MTPEERIERLEAEVTALREELREVAAVAKLFFDAGRACEQDRAMGRKAASPRLRAVR